MLQTEDSKRTDVAEAVCHQDSGSVTQDGVTLDQSPTALPDSHLPQNAARRECQKAPALRRIVADVIDRLVPCPFLVYLFFPWLFVVISYDLLSDGLLEGSSVGKRLMGLRTMIVSTGKPCNLARSFLRNIGWTVGRLLYLSLWFIPLALAYDCIELLLVLFSPTGQRLGDRLAGTQVRTAPPQKVR